MKRHSWYKTAIVATVVALTFSLAQPTKAFYLEMPQALKDLFALIKINSTHAEDSGTFRPMSPPPDGQPAPQPPRQEQQPSGLNFDGQNQDNRMMSPPNQNDGRQPMGEFQPGREPNQPMNRENPNDQKRMQFDQQMNKDNPDDQKRRQFQPQNGDNSGEQDISGRQNDQRQQGQGNDQEQQGMNGGKQGGKNGGDMGIANMKRGLKQMDNNLKRFEKMVTDLEKKGGEVPQDLKDKIAKARAISDALNSATTGEEMQAAGMDEYPELLQDLDQSRQDIFEKAQRLQDIKRNLKGMEQGLKMFEKQIAKLQKQNITLPTDISDNVAKARTAIDTIKNAKTWDEVESAGFDDLQSTFQSLDESRQQLEMLARWPQTLKQIDKQLTNLNKELKRDKSIVDKLAKGGIDLSAHYSLFAEAIAKLQGVRDDAVAKMSAGQSQEAFDAIENDFFGQMDDVSENSRIIQAMSNLGRFNQDFKRGMTDMNKTLSMLKRKNIDVAEMAGLVDQIKTKGEEVIVSIKAKPIDQDSISSDLQDLEGLRMDFSNKVQELTGGSGDMPWESGPQQFQSMTISPSLNQFMNKQPQTDSRENTIMSGSPTFLEPTPSPHPTPSTR